MFRSRMKRSWTRVGGITKPRIPGISPNRCYLGAVCAWFHGKISIDQVFQPSPGSSSLCKTPDLTSGHFGFSMVDFHDTSGIPLHLLLLATISSLHSRFCGITLFSCFLFLSE
ncbi:hypothetical protein Droror1_Dr00014391 [Drosera rotundifolia]